MLARCVGERGGSFGTGDGHFIAYAGDASVFSTCCSGDWRATAERFRGGEGALAQGVGMRRRAKFESSFANSSAMAPFSVCVGLRSSEMAAFSASDGVLPYLVLASSDEDCSSATDMGQRC